MTVVVTTLFETLYAGQSGLLELRAIGPRGKVERKFLAVKRGEFDVSLVERFTSAAVGREANVYFGVALRAEAAKGERQTGTKAACQVVTALWADLDFKDGGEPAARERLASFPLSPSKVISSGGGGLHVYWKLAKPVYPQLSGQTRQVESLLKRLAARLGADPAATDVAHVLRVPGSLNFKYSTPGRVMEEA